MEEKDKDTEKMREKNRKTIKKDPKQFLKAQVYNMSERIWKILSQPNDKDEIDDWKNKKAKTERDAIKAILERKLDVFWKKAIVVDIVTYAIKVGWEEKWMTKYQCKYWLWITISNLNSFITFCKVHGFIPMFDKIFIKYKDKDTSEEISKDVSKDKELSSFFSLAIDEISKEDSIIIALNEVKKYPKEIQSALKDLVISLREIIHFNTTIYQRTYWNKLNKFANIWSLSENIFVEIALRLENQIRDKVWIESSYLDLAEHEEDSNKKTDMKFRIKKTKNQRYQKIPMQFTNSRITWQENKEQDIEKYLIRGLRSNNKKDKIQSFILFTVNWEFSKHITHKHRWNREKHKEQDQEKGEFTIINEEYDDWINNPQEREKNIGSKFPLFIDSIDPKLIQPAEIMYIALHMLYKMYNFRYTENKTYFESFDRFIITDTNNRKIDKKNQSNINGIKLSEISVNECSIEAIEDPRLACPVLLKHRFQISYQWKRMWVIVIYEADI